MVEWVTTPSSAHLERQILTGMIVSDRALRIIGLQYKPQYFTAPFGGEVAKWCLTHQEKYGCAPRADIQTHFEAHRRHGLDPETAQLIGQLLSSISQEFERAVNFNEQLCIDTAAAYFRERSLTILKDELDYHLSGGNLNAAHASVAEFVAPASSISLGFEPLTDLERLKAAFSDRRQLFKLSGALGKMVSSLERDNSIAVVGKYKGTKSFTSQYVATQGLLSGLDIAWFDFENGPDRIDRRIAQNLCAMPLRMPPDGRVLIPVWDCQLNQTGECSRSDRINKITLIGEQGKPQFKAAPYGYSPCSVCKDQRVDTWFVERSITELDWRTAWQKFQAVTGSLMGAKLKVQSWPKFSAGVEDVKATLQVWRHLEGFAPDVIIMDQPSSMKLGKGNDNRIKIDDLWKRICGISSELHCLTLIPSQAGGKEAQERKRLKDSDVAEHSGILGHVDGSIKIDQGEEDRTASRALFSMGVERDDQSKEGYCMVLQCLDLGQPCLDSRFI